VHVGPTNAAWRGWSNEPNRQGAAASYPWRVRRSRLVVGLAIAGATVLAGCGSTVPVSHRAQQPAGNELDHGTGADGGRTQLTTGASGGSIGASGPIGSGVGRTARTGDASQTSTASGATTHVGVTASDILIGFGTEKDASTAAQTFGLNAAFGDQEGEAQAVVDDINRRGVLGRKFRLVLHDTATANALQDPNAAQQAQCSDWTEDHKVFAAVNIVGDLNGATLFGCMAKRQTPLVMSDLTSHTIADLGRFAPYLYAAGVATVDRYVPVWIDRLVADKYFTSWDTVAGAPGSAPVKIGVGYVDNDTGHQYLKLVQQALARHGLSVGDSFAFSPDTTQGLSQISPSLFRFRSNGVTHILLPENAYLVTPVAEQQHYRPRYAITTFDGLSSLTTSTSPPGQLNGSLGLGWLPVSDVDAARDPGPVSPSETHCLDVMKAGGQASTDRLVQTTQLIICDAFSFIATALTNGRDVTPEAFRRGVAALGSGFASAMTFQERYGPSRFDGASAGRDLAYVAACNCYAYPDRTDHPFPA